MSQIAPIATSTPGKDHCGGNLGAPRPIMPMIMGILATLSPTLIPQNLRLLSARPDWPAARILEGLGFRDPRGPNAQ